MSLEKIPAACVVCKAPAGAACYDFCPTRRKWRPMRVRTVSDIGALADVVDILLDHAPARARERVEMLLKERGL
jgi:hypothetical protein